MGNSAGLLMYQITKDGIEYFLIHYGGPYFKHRDKGSWSIPKGLIEKGENALETAKREFTEETGIITTPPFLDIQSIKQKGGKIVKAWAFEYRGNLPVHLHSNSFELEWPPKSGKKQPFPEVDKGDFFTEKEAREKINPAQIPFLERLKEVLQWNDNAD